MQSEPVVIEPTRMHDVGDCAVACLAMLLGRPYVEVLAAAPKRFKTCNGLTIRQMKNIAARFGQPLGYRPGMPEDDEVGILDLDRVDDGHVVIYIKGAMYNPADGMIYTDVETYLRRGKWTVDGFLWRLDS